jgi:hypothetical protein
MAAKGARSLDINIDIERGTAGLIHARGREMKNLMLTGRTDAEIWDNVGPVLRDLIEIKGERVLTMTVDRGGHRVHVDIAKPE